MLRNINFVSGLTLLGEDLGDQEGRLTSVQRWLIELGSSTFKNAESTQEIFDRMEEDITINGKSSVVVTKLKNAIYVSDDFSEEDNLKEPQFVKMIDEAGLVKMVDFEKADTSEYYPMDGEIKEYLDTFNIFGGTPVFFRVYDHEECITKLDTCLLVMGDAETVYKVLSHLEHTFRSNNPLYSRRQKEYEQLRNCNECPSDELIMDMYESLKEYPEDEVIDISKLVYYVDALNGGEIYSALAYEEGEEEAL